MKTIEMMKFGKVWYVTPRINGRAIIRECFKKEKDALDYVKRLKREGYTLDY